MTILLGLAFVGLNQANGAESAERAQATKARIDAARTEVAKIRNQVGLTLEELNRLRKENVDLRTQFQLFSRELAKMEEQAGVARERAGAMAEKGNAYFRAWEESISAISNKDIREQAQKRYNKRLKSYNKISEAMGEARDHLKPFLSDLNDLKKLLDSELSRESVNSASSLVKNANWHGEDVVDSLRDAETELDRVSNELAKYR